MGWTVPWYSSFGSDFNDDFGVTTDAGETFGLSVFLRDGDRISQTYFTDVRDVGRPRIDFNLLNLTPLGRQETWEDSPEGWPQTAPYQWWRLHDEYEDTIERPLSHVRTTSERWQRTASRCRLGSWHLHPPCGEYRGSACADDNV